MNKDWKKELQILWQRDSGGDYQRAIDLVESLIDKTNKRWEEKLKKEHWVIELPLSDLLKG